MTASPTAAPGLWTTTFRAMGTDIRLIAPRNDLERVEDTARLVFAEWDAELSRFRPDSELSRLNRGERFPVSALTLEVVRRALRWAQATDGWFDPTLGRQMRKMGYDRPFEEMDPETDPDPLQPPVATPGGGWRSVTVRPDRAAIELPAGVELDLGGIAKGMAVDATLDRLQEMGVAPVLVNAGGDLAVRGVPKFPGYWSINVGDFAAWPPLPLVRGAVATSGTERRAWRRGGARQHHLIDPRTGTPARTGVRRVTVVADSCEAAEVAAKVALLSGPEVGRRLLEEWGMAARLELDAGLVQCVGPWPRGAGGADAWKL
jgi:thiamine biosynthesis lipoprotein